MGDRGQPARWPVPQLVKADPGTVDADQAGRAGERRLHGLTATLALAPAAQPHELGEQPGHRLQTVGDRDPQARLRLLGQLLGAAPLAGLAHRRLGGDGGGDGRRRRTEHHQHHVRGAVGGAALGGEQVGRDARDDRRRHAHLP